MGVAVLGGGEEAEEREDGQQDFFVDHRIISTDVIPAKAGIK